MPSNKRSMDEDDADEEMTESNSNQDCPPLKKGL